MRRFSGFPAGFLTCCMLLAFPVRGQQPAMASPAFTVRQIMSAPYALGLTASPVGARFAWIENAEGVRNIWVAAPREPARQITHYTEDDGQDIGGLAWSPRGEFLAYTLGAESGAAGKPANPAEWQRETATAVWVVAVAGKTPPQEIGPGRSPLFFDGNGLRGGIHAKAGIDGLSLLLVRDRKIWADGRSASEAEHAAEALRYEEFCKLAATDLCDLPVSDRRVKGGVQLVYDRGTPGELTMTPDGKLLAYVSHRNGHSFIGLYDFAARTLRFVAPSTGNDSAPSFSQDSRQLAWIREPYTDAPEFAVNRVSANPWSVQVADASDLKARTVYQPEPQKPGSVIPRFATGNPRVWWAAGGKLLFCSEADGWNHLYSIDAAASLAKAVLLTPGDFEVEDVSVARDGLTALYASNGPDSRAFAGNPSGLAAFSSKLNAYADRRHLWRLDLAAAGAGVRELTGGDGIETRPVVTTDGQIVALASNAARPMRPVFIGENGTTRDVKPGSLPAGYPVGTLVTPVQVVFPSKLEAGNPVRLLVHGQLFDYASQADSSASLRNDNQKSVTAEQRRAMVKRPAIVFFHGGPRRQMLLGYPAMDYYSNAYAMNQYLASRGYIVLSVNYRCGIGYGLLFRQCEHAGADGASEYNDALAAVEYLRSRGDVDMKRVGIWGGSYGGYFTALGLARNSDLFAAGVDFHGVHEWIAEDNRDDWLRGTRSEKEAIAARAHASSPMADVDKWRSPVLLIHGDDDPEVAYRQTPMLGDALRARGVAVEELIFPDEVHDFLLHKNWVKAYEATADFFDRKLK